jgi:hypothetical protein
MQPLVIDLPETRLMPVNPSPANWFSKRPKRMTEA